MIDRRGQGEVPDRVAPVRVEPERHDDDRARPLEDRLQGAVHRLEEAVVGQAGGLGQVEVLAGTRPFARLVPVAEEERVLPRRIGVNRGVEDVAPAPEDLLGAVAMVIVDVEDRDALAGRSHDRLGCDRGVVEEAVAARHRSGRVVAGRAAEPVRGPLSGENEVNRREGDVDRGAGRAVRSLDDRVGGVEPPPAKAAGDGLRLGLAGDERRAHPLEHAERRVRVGDEIGPVDPLLHGPGPGALEEPDEPGIVDRGDRRLAVLRRFGEREAAVRLETRPDDLRALRHLVGRDRLAEIRLVGDVMGEMFRCVNDLHGYLLGPKPTRAAARESPRSPRPAGSA